MDGKRVAEIAWIGLGSNLGDKAANLMAAAYEISLLPASSLLTSSSIYRSTPVGEGFTDDFYNAVVGLLTGLEPRELLKECLRIESDFGRNRRMLDRIIDLDILLFGDRIINTRSLSVPHPAMERRKFVLEPLVEAAPNAVHPIHKVEIKTMLEGNLRTQEVEKLDILLFPGNYS